MIQTLSLALLAAAPDAAAAPAAETQGVSAYPPAFFAQAQPATAFDMITRLPGFSFDGGSGVRGFAGAAGNVLVNGERPTTKSDDLQSILRRIPASQVARVDVVRGGAPGIDMQGKTIIANVILKSGDSVTGLVGVANTFVWDGRQAPALRLEGVRRGNGRTLEGSFVIAGFTDDGSGDGPLVRRDPAGVITDRAFMSSEGDGMQAVGTTAYETPVLGGKFRVNGRLFFQRFYFGERDVFSTSSDIATDRELEERIEGEVGLRYGRDLGPRTKLETLFIQQLKSSDFDLTYRVAPDEELFSNSRTLGETIGRTTLSFARSDTLSFETGGEVAFNWLESETRYSANGVPVALPAANVTVEERRAEIFGQGTWKPSSMLTLEGGLRVEGSRISSEGDVSLEKTLVFAKPRLVVTWSPDKADQFRLRLEREVGQLNFGDFVASSQINSGGSVTTGNPDLNPQQSLIAEIAYERRFWAKGSVTLTLRHFEFTDVIDRTPEVVVATCPLLPGGQPDLNAPSCVRFDHPGNIGEGSRNAALLDFTLPLDKFGIPGGLLRGDASIRVSEVEDPTTGETRRISGEHPQDWDLTFTQDIPAWKINWGVEAYGGWRETYYRYNRVETVKLRTFVSPFIEWKPRPDTSLLFQIQNATSRDLVRLQDFYAGPRNFSPLVARESRQLDNQPLIYVRLRKQFG
ncbi:MAG: TonB-dependent receptor [Caulobacterales bacterium]|nr:TonB-dependent receptor [Caulobacterales bacterium]